MNNASQGGVMLRVLICSKRDLRPDLAATVVGRQGIEVYRVDKFADARLVGSSLGVQVILVDRDFPDAATFIRQLRKEPATRDRSIAVLTPGSKAERDQELVAAGANAILRIPADAGWDERFSKLLTVPVRQQARLMAHIEAATESTHAAAMLNLSPRGMLLATQRSLRMGDEIKFRFTLPSKATVIGSGRVAREAPPTAFGVEFIEIEGEGRGAILDYLRSARLG